MHALFHSRPGVLIIVSSKTLQRLTMLLYKSDKLMFLFQAGCRATRRNWPWGHHLQPRANLDRAEKVILTPYLVFTLGYPRPCLSTPSVNGGTAWRCYTCNRHLHNTPQLGVGRICRCLPASLTKPMPAEPGVPWQSFIQVLSLPNVV